MQITEKKVSVLKGLCAVEGVETNGIHTGFKAQDKDLALIYFPDGATVTGVFTRNKVKAHSVLYDMEMLKNFTNFKAILVNSGNANACNGLTGEQDVHTMTDSLAGKLNIDAHEVLVSSTGVIGEPLNLQPFYSGLDTLVSGLKTDDSTSAAEAIMTTDTVPKQLSFEADIGGETVHFGAMIKGAGMIHPNMGTMLGYIVTDAGLSQDALNTALKSATDDSFNVMTVDGDTSTNDTVLLASTNKVMLDESHLDEFTAVLTAMCQKLSQMIARDAEGATKFVTVNVVNAASKHDAVSVAKTVATSSLVKTAIYGQDANWGRVIMAIGNSDAETLSPDAITIKFAAGNDDVLVCHEGLAVPFDEGHAYNILSNTDVEIFIDLNAGEHSSQVWTCDMSVDYVKINADYRS
ncbi:bifunctional glutamate N-acetyltransferase/amino-acid acetyltransferase ArgJ [Jeotgalicoccus psychrophilus]|uniref:bifunctional glutamate N-acetyltransferase/amino-acid acetyltransferase ArgJ n=1 Tax=Jeotgalicoccus psychrophilus TaxID=157228 RepID=UPI0004093841|nr:bifunctional glutamate N-acetyltransferase/amino-acid acetyltransferase ArgJ [Jeotgalicoccus psychrophilus]